MMYLYCNSGWVLIWFKPLVLFASIGVSQSQGAYTPFFSRTPSFSARLWQVKLANRTHRLDTDLQPRSLLVEYQGYLTLKSLATYWVAAPVKRQSNARNCLCSWYSYFYSRALSPSGLTFCRPRSSSNITLIAALPVPKLGRRLEKFAALLVFEDKKMPISPWYMTTATRRDWILTQNPGRR